MVNYKNRKRGRYEIINDILTAISNKTGGIIKPTHLL